MAENEIIKKVERLKKAKDKQPHIDIKTRREALKNLRSTIKEMEKQICDALYADLGKSETESYMTEIGLVLSEISYMLHHIKRLTSAKRVYTPISPFPAKSKVIPSAHGVVLVLSPWNYPFMLSIEPLVDAVTAGNRVILKPSSRAPQTGKVISQIVSKVFAKDYVDVVLGSSADCDVLLDCDFDYIFYTGSTRVGHLVMQKASEHFTPVTLEMGGKSPCIVDETANIKLTAKRIVVGKFLNCGQTCVAPDYLLCHESIKDALVKEIECEIIRQYTIDPLSNPSYPHMINEKQFDAMAQLIDKEKVIFGGKTDKSKLKIEPTLQECAPEDAPMQNEIFGPILPVLTFKNLQEVAKIVKQHENPLAFYFFSNSRKNKKWILENCQFGGGCVNDTIMHIANNHLGFGGVRQSGLGQYHGKVGFEAFSHNKSVIYKSNWLDLPMRYQPFGKLKKFLIKLFLR